MFLDSSLQRLGRFTTTVSLHPDGLLQVRFGQVLNNDTVVQQNKQNKKKKL